MSPVPAGPARDTAAASTPDHAPAWFGMSLVERSPDRCVMTMTVRTDMANAHGVCHGGVLFSLADTAFGVASNAAGAPSMAVGCSIQFLAPARIGDALTATCTQQYRGRRRALYDTRITDQDGRLIALFRGESSALSGSPDTGRPA